jgi:hypothetical protein
MRSLEVQFLLTDIQLFQLDAVLARLNLDQLANVGMAQRRLIIAGPAVFG